MFSNSTEVQWSDVKAFLDSRKIPAQYIDFKDTYWIMAIDGPFSIWCRIPKTDPKSTEQTDFEDNYKSNANRTFSDSDGSLLQRKKVTQSGWQYQMLGFEIKTATADGIYAYDPEGNAIANFTYIMYDNNGNITTNPLLCVKTVVDFEPPYDFELIGGGLFQKSVPTTDIYYSVIGVPDIPSQYGGSKVFVNSIDISFVGLNSELKADGRASKKLTYDENLHTNKLRIILRHNAGHQHKVLQLFEIFKP